MELGEAAARDAGYKTIELGATKAGMPLYLAKGYRETERSPHARSGESFDGDVVIKMVKRL